MDDLEKSYWCLEYWSVVGEVHMNTSFTFIDDHSAEGIIGENLLSQSSQFDGSKGNS